MSGRLLIIDDDVELCELVTEFLSGYGFEVDAVHGGMAGAERALSGRYELVILDVMLPGIDGFEVLRQLRRLASTPVLMLTARGDDVDRIVGLELGADDYLSKPFNPRELAARIRAILRRIGNRAEPAGLENGPAPLAVDDLTINFRTREVTRQGAAVPLTSTEFDLLGVMLRSAGRVIERGELFRLVLDRPPDPLDRSIDMHVSHLRKKLGNRQDGGHRIKAVRGVGYLYAVVENQRPSPQD